MPLGVVVLVHFILVALALVPVGQLMGRLFGRFQRLRAYSLDLFGSLAGVVLFGVLSAFRTSPAIWFGLAVLIVFIFFSRGGRERAQNAVAGVLLMILVVSMSYGGRIWSPYYMVTVVREAAGFQDILTNGMLHQVILDFDHHDDYINKSEKRFSIAYKMAKSLDDVLIVGAGSGNDVVMAKKMGAKNIDAVEIDPVFFELGEKLHPQKPYGSQNVTQYRQDARTYFKNTKKKYDLIVFGTLDSQALLGALSSVRLDNYVYTRQAFKEAHNLLKPDGMIAVFHMSMTGYIADRISVMLGEVAGRPPVRFYFSDHTLFNYLFIQPRGTPDPDWQQKLGGEIRRMKIPTDDWPFLYLKHPSIPWHYGQVLLGILVLGLIGTATAMGGKFTGFDLRLFFMGAGFLLLETKSVTQMSLLFGSTWVVNLLVFSSILAVLYMANRWVIAQGENQKAFDVMKLFWILCGLLVLLSLVPVSWIAGKPLVLRWILGGLLVALPIGVAGLLFPAVFQEALNTQAGFASNLLGALLGGCAEYAAMLLGIRSLTLIAALFYLSAAWFYQKQRR
jgi:MFS family permease